MMRIRRRGWGQGRRGASTRRDMCLQQLLRSRRIAAPGGRHVRMARGRREVKDRAHEVRSQKEGGSHRFERATSRLGGRHRSRSRERKGGPQGGKSCRDRGWNLCRASARQEAPAQEGPEPAIEQLPVKVWCASSSVTLPGALLAGFGSRKQAIDYFNEKQPGCVPRFFDIDTPDLD